MQSWKVCSIFFLFLLVVSLACGGGCKKKKNVFIPMEGNDAPVVVAIPDQSADYGVSFILDLTPYVTDDHDPIGDLTFAVTSSLGTFTGATFSGTFTTPGDVMIPFRVTDTDDAATSAVFKITVNPIPNTAPTVDAIAEQDALVGREFTLDVATVGNVADDRDAVGDLIFRVTAGGGSFTGGVYTNTFVAPGLTAVDFEIEDLDGAITSDSFNVMVYEIPVADFTADQTFGFGTLMGVNFTDTSTGNPSEWAWDLDGDGTIDSYQQTPAAFDYTTPGWYTVSLTVGLFGTSDTETKTAYIHVSGSVGGADWYVDGTTGDDADDGLSWDNAFLTIQMALNSAAPTDIVRVADGTYAGAGNTELDFAGNDIYLMSENGSSVCAIDCAGLRAFNFQNAETPDATVRGFYIVNGFDGTYGGGILCNNSNPTIVDCLFVNCGSGQGGGICGLNSNSAIVNCVFSINYGINGCGVYFDGSANPEITNCIFDTNDGDSGAGIYSLFSNPTIVNCTFVGGYADFGAGIYSWGSFSTVTNCTFDTNEAERGAGIYAGNSDFTITGCMLDNCTVITHGAAGPGLGGAVHGQGANILMRDCTIKNNASLDFSGGGFFVFSGSTLIIEDCDVTNNTCPGDGGGIYLDGPMLTIEDSDISSNTAGWGGGVSCFSPQISITDCDITNNNTPGGAGAGIYTEDSFLEIAGCNISYNNAAGGDGGGIYAEADIILQMIGCAIVNNVADYGGAVAIYDACTLTLTSCTVANNFAELNGGGFDTFDTQTLLRNSILWANTTAGTGHQINTWSVTDTITFSYCDYSDDAGADTGTGTFDYTDNNISVDPMFATSGDGSLQAGSPCIDAGFNLYAILLGLDEDLLGNDRMIDGDGNGTENIDIGAFEYQP